MDKDRINQPAPDMPEETAETLDPNATWSPQPSRLYSEFDAAAAEGAKRPDAITEADALMEQRQDLGGGCAAPGNSPFVIAAHAVEHTDGDVHDNPDCSVALRSGQGQSGHGEPPVILPNVGGAPPNEVSVISLPVARPRQGT
jgi:hypothetical protein